MTDPLFLGVIALTLFSHLCAFALGHVIGSGALKSRGPLLPCDDAPGDCWPAQVEIPVHAGGNNDARA